MPIRKPQSNDGHVLNPPRIPRLNRKPKRAYLSTGLTNSPNAANGPTSPVMSELGAIELQGSELLATVAAGTDARRESASTANGSTTANSVHTRTNGADPTLSTLAIKSPTLPNANSLFPENHALNPIPNRFNSVQSSSYSPTETGSDYTFNTGSRSHRSAFIPFNFTNLWRSSSAITPPRRTVPESEGANLPAIDREADFRPVVPPKQLNLAPMTGPNEISQSLFDSDSDSDSERYQSPILSEAQTSSVARPYLIEHKSSTRAPQRNIVGLRTAAANLGLSMSKPSQVLGTDFKDLHELTPASQKDDPLKSHPVERHPSLLVPGMHGAVVAKNYSRNESVSAASTTDTHDFAERQTPSPALSFTTSSVVEGQPLDDEAFDTMPSPRVALGGLHPLPTLHSQQHYQPSLDTFANAGGVKRTASAPPLRRIVRINTEDVIVKMGPGGNRFHRESVVSTPYPTRDPSLQDTPSLLTNNDTHPNNAIPQNTAPPSAIAAPSRPSPFEKIVSRKQDTLILRLSVTSHPLLARTITIPLSQQPNTNTPSSYDDHHLFATLRKEYHTLIGPTRRYLTARTFAAVAYHGPGSLSDFDALDFLEHFSDSSLGKRRRKWVLWARRMAAHRSNPNSAHPSTPQPDSAIHPDSARQDSIWDNIELAGMHPPALPVPRLEFSHRFSVVKVAFAVLATLIAAIAAVVLWTLLGLPRSVTGPFGPFGKPLGLGFRNSGARLQTGLVFGITVLLFGLAGVGSWVGGSWVVL